MMTSKLPNLLKSPFIKYGLMAVVVVAIEIVGFWLMNSLLQIHYLIATVLSLGIGIVLNWIGSRYFVFGNSKHHVAKEFTLVLITSLFGVALQTSTVYLLVTQFSQQPITGKVIAIIVTFFWNYIVRKHYIYKAGNVENI